MIGERLRGVACRLVACGLGVGRWGLDKDGSDTE